MDTKLCPDCGSDLPISEFWKAADRRDGLQAYCKTHQGIRAKRCYDPQKAFERKMRQMYGLTPEAYAALLAAQGGKCKICRRDNSAKRRFHVDHDHACCPGTYTCGRCVRGILCKDCNQLLGFAREDPAVLSAAIGYLEAA